MSAATDKINKAKSRHEDNQARFDKQRTITLHDTDNLVEFKLKIAKSFDDFSQVWQGIQNTQNLSQYSQNGVTIPPYNGVDIIEASKASIITLQLLKGAALGTASAFLAVGAIQGASSVMKATSTMSSVSVAALNSALASMTGSTMLTAEGTGTTAALGTDSLAASSGLALGSVALGGATLGLGFLVGGISLCMSGSDLQDQADTAWEHMKKSRGTD